MSQHILAVIVLALICASGASASTQQSPGPPRGTLMLIGGGERDNNILLWTEFLRLAGGSGKRVVIFPTASGNPQRTGDLYAQFFRSLGLDPVVVPLSPKLSPLRPQDLTEDGHWVHLVRSSDAVFLAGGDQLLYRQSLLDRDGQDTPMLSAIRRVYQRGGLVAGSSAGTAVMSRLMFIEAESMVAVLRDGARMHREVDGGFGLMPDAWFVDQHFLTRGRFGRSLVAMQQHGFAFGLGVDEDTALIVEQGRLARVVGYRGVVVMDASKATRDVVEPRFNWRNVQLSFISHGDRIDLLSRKITPGTEKRDAFRIDPYAPGFEPYYLEPQFRTDIFANSTLLDLMSQLVDSPFDEAIGLAFDGAAARTGPTPGFELRFHRVAGTVSWDSPTAPGDPNTVLDVRLDIRPIDVHGPLYD